MHSFAISRTEAGFCRVFVDGQSVWGGDVTGDHSPSHGLLMYNLYPQGPIGGSTYVQDSYVTIAEIAQIKITTGVPVRTGNYTPTYPLP